MIFRGLTKHFRISGLEFQVDHNVFLASPSKIYGCLYKVSLYRSESEFSMQSIIDELPDTHLIVI